MYFTKSNQNLLFSTVVLIIINIQYASPSYIVIRRQDDLLTVGDMLCFKYNSLGFVNNTFIGCRCGNGNFISHALIKDKFPYCYASTDLGCYISLRNRKSGDVSPKTTYELDYPDATYTYSLLESYTLQIWNIDLNKVEFWNGVTETFWKKYFEITQNGLVVKDLQNVWDGHAIRIIFKFKNKPEQCLFIKVPGRIVYPVVIKDIPASKVSQAFITPSANFQSIPISLSLSSTVEPTPTSTQHPKPILSTNIQQVSISSSMDSLRRSSMIMVSSVMLVSSSTRTRSSEIIHIKSSSSREQSSLSSKQSTSSSVQLSSLQTTATSKSNIASTSSKIEALQSSLDTTKATVSQSTRTGNSEINYIKSSSSRVQSMTSSDKLVSLPSKTTSLSITPERISSSISLPTVTSHLQVTASVSSIRSSTVVIKTTIPPTDEKKNDNAPMIAGVTVSLVGLLLFILVAFYVARKRLKRKGQVQPEDQLALGEDVQSCSHSISSADDEMKKNALKEGEQTFHTTSK